MTNPQTPITNPEERNAWKFGFTPQAEIWNGRLAQIGFLAAVLIELFSGQGLLHFWGLM
ncbi:MAG: high light inducible protein [Oscillatoria sp. PMC 1068.18]|nr:high light inducible protein [Oscillatoria sp. PMC 1076.18]MEC4988292.1 high light inducible protein [Oscillatoria sp. PMC 1068.18]